MLGGSSVAPHDEEGMAWKQLLDSWWTINVGEIATG